MNSTTENPQILRNLCFCDAENPSNIEIPAGYKILFVKIEDENFFPAAQERNKEFDFDFMDTLINYWFPTWESQGLQKFSSLP